jgi:hypothetical protein
MIPSYYPLGNLYAWRSTFLDTHKARLGIKTHDELLLSINRKRTPREDA